MLDNKNYIISFTAQLKNDKVVISGLRNMQGEVQKFSKTVDAGGKSAKTYGQTMLDLGKRALIVAPIWMAIRTAMLFVIRSTQDAIKANLDFEESMARNKTLLTGSAFEINAQMALIGDTVKNMAVNSRVSLKEITDSFYFLRTSALTTSQALSALPVVVDLMQGSLLGAQESARAVAGMFNTMGKSVKGASSDQEKFTKIGDQLAYTVATQDVLLGELLQGYAKIAPFASSLNDSFGDIITTMGFLNTQLLKGGRAGRLTAQAIIALSKEAMTLASEFGITFDPNKPLSFVEAVDKLNYSLTDSTTVTKKQQDAFNKVFNVRASVPLRLLVAEYDKYKKALQAVEKDSVGFNKLISEMRTETTVAQIKRLGNIVAVLSGDFFDGFTNGKSFAQVLKTINDELAKHREGVKKLGDLFSSWSALGLFLKIKELERVKELMKTEEGRIKLKAEEQDKENRKIITQSGILNKNNSAHKETLTSLKSQNTLYSTRETILKSLGASEVYIAQARLKQIQALLMEGRIEGEDATTQYLKAQNALLLAQINMKQQMASQNNRLRLDYALADRAGERQINRAIELRNMSARDLEIEVGAGRQSVLQEIEQVYSSLSGEQQQGVASGLKSITSGMTELTEVTSTIAETAGTRFISEMEKSWNAWEDASTPAIDRFAVKMSDALNRAFVEASTPYDEMAILEASKPKEKIADSFGSVDAGVEGFSLPMSPARSYFETQLWGLAEMIGKFSSQTYMGSLTGVPASEFMKTSPDKKTSGTVQINVTPHVKVELKDGNYTEYAPKVIQAVIDAMISNEDFQAIFGKKMSDKV